MERNIQQIVKSNGCAADIEAANKFQFVALYQWDDGDLLVLDLDEEIPTEDEDNDNEGYVFWIATQTENGGWEYEGKRYDIADICDHILWDGNLSEVEAKYNEVLQRARTNKL